ncbi:MAG: VanZ family protein [Oscillospiraceae bacterium]|jgi:glycopeptide antibiotics resistance protein|nr:VanZ family protein [Oscillospiraceae bacterium]
MKKFNRLLLAVSILFILTITVFPPYSDMRNLNRTVFRTFEIALREWRYNGTLRYFRTNILGNIALFIPFGYFAWLSGFRKTIFLGMLLSICIEAAQYPMGRWTDIDDVILNTIGTAAGFGLAVLWRRIRRNGHR